MTSDATETTGSTAESQSFTYGVSAADVVDAEMRIAPHAPVTPVRPVRDSQCMFALGKSEIGTFLGTLLLRPDASCPLLQVYTCSTLNKLAGCSMFFKAEVFQRTGSFKFRGAANAVFSLTVRSQWNHMRRFQLHDAVLSGFEHA